MEVVMTCPLNAKCEEIKDNTLHRCNWYIQIAGTTPQGDQVNERRCSMSWLPLLQLETNQGVRGVASAVESTRNVQDERQKQAIESIKAIGNG